MEYIIKTGPKTKDNKVKNYDSVY